ncbi:ribonuclease H-like domain-containing protein [Tanacetum coccineum]
MRRLFETLSCLFCGEDLSWAFGQVREQSMIWSSVWGEPIPAFLSSIIVPIGSLQPFKVFPSIIKSSIGCHFSCFDPGRTKHIEIDIHFVRDLVAAGQVRVLHVPSRYQFADIFTKGLPTALFEEFCFSLSVRCLPAQTAKEC